ncbi:MAG: 50S ribosomal protein L22 [Sedimentisphaerales bacterium]|nr:50S ribosomal protein L22 [Sedimentisphaerales bacterium]
MLSSSKLKQLSKERKVSVEQLAEQLARTGLDKPAAVSAVRNWQKGLMRPIPRKEDIQRLATAFGVEVAEMMDWQSSYRYAAMSPRKARLVTQLIAGRPVQDALDVLKFTHKRAAEMVSKTLRAAIADADEQEADVEALYVSEARVDDAGTRIGTKQFIAKDRGRAHPIHKKGCHIHITVTQP